MRQTSNGKTSPRKTYRQRLEAREKLDRAVRQLSDECTFRPCDFFTFERGNLTQEGMLVISRTDPQGRYLVLHTWPDVLGDPYRSTWKALCPPRREHFAKAVCRAAEAFCANGGVERLREEAEAHLEAAMIGASVREMGLRAREAAVPQKAVSEAFQ
ncbi:MAG: hypothetical protein ACRYFS_08105 [Janthinobacterium lividum]